MDDSIVNAEKAYRAKKYKEALKLYKEALNSDPKNASIMAEIADCLYYLLHVEEAIVVCERALAIDPTLLKPHVLLSYLYNDLTKSSEHAKIAMELDPNSGDANCSYGLQLARGGEILPAIQYLEKATQLDPDLYLAHYNLSVCYQDIGDLNGLYRQDQILFRLKPNLRNLTGLVASYFGLNRFLFFMFFFAPLGVIVDARFKILLVFHLFLILLYISSVWVSWRSKKWALIKRNSLTVAVLIILDFFILLNY